MMIKTYFKYLQNKYFQENIIKIAVNNIYYFNGTPLGHLRRNNKFSSEVRINKQLIKYVSSGI